MQSSIKGFNSITWKAVSFMAGISLLIAGCFYIVYRAQAKEFNQYNKAAISSVIDFFKLSVTDYIVTGDSKAIAKTLDQSIHDKLIHGIRIFQDNKVVLQYPTNLDVGLESTEVFFDSGYSKELGQTHFNLYINKEAINKSQDRFFYIAMIFIILVLGTITAIWYYINKRFVRPLQKLSDSAKLIAQGKYVHFSSNSRNDEIGILAKSLQNMSNALKEREAEQESHVRELVNTHGETVLASQERTRYLNNIINDTAPYLTEALVSLQSLSDRPIQRQMLTKAFTFVAAQLEQARSIIAESNVNFRFEMEKFSLTDFSKVVREYAMFFSKAKNIEIDFKLKTDPFVEIKDVMFLLDTKILIKMFSLVFEIMSPKTQSWVASRYTIMLIIDGISNEVADIDIIVKKEGCDISAEECLRINQYFYNKESKGCELEELSSENSRNKYALISLKSLADKLRADFTIHHQGNFLESRFSCKVLCCSLEESVSDRYQRFKDSVKNIDVVLIGSHSVISQASQSKNIITVIDYESFLQKASVNKECNYVIDFISDGFLGKKCVEFFLQHRLEEKNLAVLCKRDTVSDSFIEYSYEMGVDMILQGYMDLENVKKLQAQKVSVLNNLSLSGFIATDIDK